MPSPPHVTTFYDLLHLPTVYILRCAGTPPPTYAPELLALSDRPPVPMPYFYAGQTLDLRRRMFQHAHRQEDWTKTYEFLDLVWYAVRLEDTLVLAQKESVSSLVDFRRERNINLKFLNLSNVEMNVKLGKSYISPKADIHEKMRLSSNLLPPAEEALKKICKQGGSIRTWLLSLPSIANLRDFRSEEEQTNLKQKIRERALALRDKEGLGYKKIVETLKKEFGQSPSFQAMQKWVKARDNL